MPSFELTHPSVWCFSLFAAAEPSVMPRVVGEFARLGMVPARFEAVVDGDALSVDVQIAGLGDDAARHIAERLRGIVEVDRVLMAAKAFANEARA